MQTAFLGDLILSIPLLKQIKRKYPNDRLVLVCKAGLGEYFLNEKIVDLVFEIKKNDRTSYQNMITKINLLKVDNLFCIHRSLRSQLTCWKINAKNKIGFQSKIGFFIFNKLVQFQNAWPEALRQLFILSETDSEVKNTLALKEWSYLNKPTHDGVLPPLPGSSIFNTNAIVKKQSSKKIAIFPGSVWATKQWTENGFVFVANSFINLGYEVFLMGGPSELQLCLAIQKLCAGSQVLAGEKSISQSIEFIKTCDLVIANDSAPTHMAAFQNIPVISIFGPTTLEMGFRPWSSNAIIIENNDLDCRPCGKHGHQRCPLGHHKCMKDIEASRVLKAGITLLSASQT